MARGALRRILGGYLGVDPGALVFAHGPSGKPFLPGSRLCFNVSHSGSLVLVVVAHGRQVGVDVEQVRAVPEADAIATRFCSPSEQEALGRIPPADRQGAFLALWTCKEALAKLTGEGVGALPLDVVRDAPPGCRMEPLHDLPGYAACVAAEGNGWRLERHALTSWMDERSSLEWCAPA
jgi:4'-phosphopantetheinyl transferase